jgi:hypothetical protein
MDEVKKKARVAQIIWTVGLLIIFLVMTKYLWKRSLFWKVAIVISGIFNAIGIYNCFKGEEDTLAGPNL